MGNMLGRRERERERNFCIFFSGILIKKLALKGILAPLKREFSFKLREKGRNGIFL